MAVSAGMKDTQAHCSPRRRARIGHAYKLSCWRERNDQPANLLVLSAVPQIPGPTQGLHLAKTFDFTAWSPSCSRGSFWAR